MNIIFFGSPAYSRTLLKEIYKKHNIVCVISNPDKISDRTRKPKPTPVSEFALENHIPLYRPENLKDNIFLNEISQYNIDIGVVFSYGKIIPEELYNIPLYGCINLHGSLLPDLRGASPLQTAIIKGYKKSGWTVQKVSKGLDEGDILEQVNFDIFDDETTGELLERVLPSGINLVLRVLDDIQYYLNHAKKQDNTKATYCYKIQSELTQIDWRKNTLDIHNLVRALSPNPVAKTKLKKNEQVISNIKIYKTNYKIDTPYIDKLNKNIDILPGTIQVIKHNKRNHFYVKSGNGWIEILEIQYPNKKKLDAHDFINGNFVQEGDIFV